MKRLQSISRPAVVAEFLRSEFHCDEFSVDRSRHESIVLSPDLENPAENSLRRELLFRRRRYVWQELPPDTQWFKVGLERDEVPRLRVFPRGRLRRAAGRELSVGEYASAICSNGVDRRLEDIGQILAIRDRLRHTPLPAPTPILLVGTDEDHPVSILEGNHRMIAAALVSLDVALEAFQFYAGFSERMVGCVWYRNNYANLWRYAQNRLRSYVVPRTLNENETV